MQNLNDRPDMPLGLGYALAANSSALKAFAELSSERQRQIIENSRSVTSKTEMRKFVENIKSKEN